MVFRWPDRGMIAWWEVVKLLRRTAVNKSNFIAGLDVENKKQAGSAGISWSMLLCVTICRVVFLYEALLFVVRVLMVGVVG